jgi:hypothetical protein
MMRILAALVALVTALGCPALAQDRPPQGIGFAQAEEGTWLCRHEHPEEALACARELCSEQAPGQDCWPTAWCFPAGWSGMMVVWLPDFHFTETLCGAPSEAALVDALRTYCTAEEAATHCDLSTIVDPEGNERTVENQSFPGPAAPAELQGTEGESEEAGDSPQEPAQEPAGP